MIFVPHDAEGFTITPIDTMGGRERLGLALAAGHREQHGMGQSEQLTGFGDKPAVHRLRTVHLGGHAEQASDREHGFAKPR
ncbi:MAG: hypothetical protein H0U20_04425 [Thermoleophilaceae bacterium]|nr:hypothetical protein [Thermoleophilaceae bacterium]